MVSYDPSNVRMSALDWVAQQARRYEESGGTEATEVRGAPCLLLDYKGRKSGEWHRTVLIYGRDGEDYLVVASKGGHDTHPAWYLSLIEYSGVHVRVGNERFEAHAQTLSPEEKARVWPHLLDVYADYAEYQRNTERDIPVVRIRRV
ncbi:nitroreductase family deazaflavin-dependent oxidoreductase [Streptomyces sp. I6]|uniref:nitroreductase family deazaflavin-dependent oxidoreductase n=1 Tax=Streptomyces sp. I6 TaxID=2483113 RepID=UPI000F44DB31|nr:nitroreductase family deazaflavin-dependent oxidoreductase [Streptomyces sp. I6]RNL74409.1 nitroreductase family deazaflavin-dependent oxidoreductase [Streptomyces sp. I6]